MCLGVPGRVIAVGTDELCTSPVAFGPIVKRVSLVYVPEARPGDYVIVHAGFAITRLDEREAERVLSFLEQVEAEP
jgi:hydrogenase expression/formation protein HypC